MHTPTQVLLHAVSVAHRILWKGSNLLQAISSLQDSCKDQSQAVSEEFSHVVVQTRYTAY